jgi:hypothetical protein
MDVQFHSRVDCSVIQLGNISCSKTNAADNFPFVQTVNSNTDEKIVNAVFGTL